MAQPPRLRSPDWLCAVAVVACFTLPTAAHAARTDWREMSVGHFHLYSTIGESATRNVAIHLQAFEQTIGELLQADDRLPDVPTFIYLLSHEDFTKYAISRPAGGFFAGRDFANYLVVDGKYSSDAIMNAVFHEYTHFVQLSTSTTRYPPWYMEGYAELFSAFRVKDNVIVVGEAPENLSMTLDKRDWIPIERVLAVTNDSKEYRTEQLMPQFYGESWALVHYLLFDTADLRLPTHLYLTNLDGGYPEDGAFQHAFSFDKSQLNDTLRKMLQKGRIVSKRLTFKSAPEIERAELTRLSAPSADAELARLTLAIGRPKAIVEPLMAAALAENPSDPAMRALAARAAAHYGGTIDVDALVGSLGPGVDAPRVRMDLADALFSSNHNAEIGGKAATLLDQIVQADSPPIEAVLEWARGAVAAKRRPGTILDVLEPALARAPHNMEILTLLASGAEWVGDRAKAREYYTRLILVGPTPEIRAWAVKQADSERLQEPVEAKH